MKQKSFTLIELLVVTASIILLVTIILVNIWRTRMKAKDTSIQSFMYQVRNAVEFYYINNNKSYIGSCDADNTLSNYGDLGVLETAIKKENRNRNVTCFISTDGKDFAASSPLVYRNGKHWCVEAAGFSIEINHPITSFKCE